MGYSVALKIRTFDNVDAGASVPGSSTATVRTITGRGAADVVLDGTGNSFVTIKYSVDGGADTAIATADQTVYISLAFTTSLVIKAVNADSSAHAACGVSSTGIYQ